MTEFAGPKNDGPSEGRGSEQYRLFYPITIEDQLATLKTANTTPGEISARGEYFSNEMAAAFSDSLPNILIRTASCPEKPFFFKNGVPGEATCCQVELRAGDKFYLPIGNGIVTENPTLVVAEQAHSTASTAFTPHFSPAAFLELSTKQTSDPEFCEYLREIGEVALQNTRQRSWPGIDALLVSDVCPGTAPTHWIASTPLGKFDLLVLLDGTGQIACSAWDHLNIPQIETALCSESVARWPRTAFVLELAAAFKKMLPPEVLTTGVKLGSPVEDVMQKADLVRISGGSLLCKIPEGAEACSIILDLKLPLLQIPDPDAVTMIHGKTGDDGPVVESTTAVVSREGFDRFWRNAWRNDGRLREKSELGLWLASYFGCNPGDCTASRGCEPDGALTAKLTARYQGRSTTFSFGLQLSASRLEDGEWDSFSLEQHTAMILVPGSIHREIGRLTLNIRRFAAEYGET